MTICHIDGCSHRVAERGLCSTHSKRMTVFGDPLGGKPMRARKGEIDAFLADAILHDSDDCFLWPYAKNSAGYGHFQRGTFRSLAHRYVCEMTKGAPFDGAVAAHECGNGHLSCVNPKHLSWKTPGANSADMIRHGKSMRGKHPRSVLNQMGAAYIKKNAGKLTISEMVDFLGVSRGVVHQVLKGKSWIWVDLDARERAA